MFRSARAAAALTVTASALTVLPGTAAASYGPSVFSFASVADSTCTYQWFIPHYTQPSITFLKTTPAAGQPAAVRVDATFTNTGSPTTTLATVTLTTPGTQQNVNLGRFGGWTAHVHVTFADGTQKFGSTGFATHGNPPCSF